MDGVLQPCDSIIGPKVARGVHVDMGMRQDTITAQCPDCKEPIRVLPGRKDTVREAQCGSCGSVWRYSAWTVRIDRTPTGTVTYHQVDLVRGG